MYVFYYVKYILSDQSIPNTIQFDLKKERTGEFPPTSEVVFKIGLSIFLDTLIQLFFFIDYENE